MITYTTKLDDKYISLFEEIAERGGPKIENLEQFFGNIQEIAQIDEKFLRLPLDEPMFEINANTRKIDVDSTPFKANGVAVQGDHLAETIFFKIDKYFDYMDLMNTDIYIKWKIGNESGRDKCFIKSDSIIPGSIVFGWAISDKMTGKSGTLSFAIELEITQDNGKKYSFNTLVANLAVKDGLVLLNPEVYDMKDNVLAILSNSEFTSDGTAPVEPVIWVSGNGNGLVTDLNGEFSPIINLDGIFENGALSSEPVKLYALATSGRDASILYSDKNKVTQSSYIPAPDGELNDNVVYYVKENSLEAISAYRVAEQSEREAWGTADQIDLYVQVIEIIIDDVGEYYVYAQGVKYDENDNKIGASSIVTSAPVIVPPAEEPVAINIISSVEHPEIEGYTFDETAKNTIYLVDDDAVINFIAFAEFKEKDNFGLLAFEWYKDGIRLSEGEPIYFNENESAYSISTPGDYYVKGYHYRNNETKSKISETKIVSTLASPIESLDKISITGVKLHENYQSAPITTNYSLTNPANAKNIPEFNCILERLAKDSEGNLTDEISQTFIIGDCTSSVLDGKSGVLTWRLPATRVLKDGDYRLRISHIYNGSIYSTASDPFTINID